MIAPNQSIPDNLRETLCVEDVLSALRYLNERDPQIIRLEVRDLQGALRRHGFYADLVTVESAAGWLLVDALEITA
jgi:hypothetical protein